MSKKALKQILSDVDCALLASCYNVEPEKIAAALQNNANVNVVLTGDCPGIDCPRIYQGYTPILVVAEHIFGISEKGSDFRKRIFQAFEILLENGADINAVAGEESFSVLVHAAIYESDCEFLRFLLEHGADPNLPYEVFGGSILYETAFHIDEDRADDWSTPSEKVCAAVDLLMDYGAMSQSLHKRLESNSGIGAVNSLDETAVMQMKRIGKYDIGCTIEEILQLNRKHFRGALDILEEKTLSMVKLLNERKAAEFDSLTLRCAIQSGFPLLIEYLLGVKQVTDFLSPSGIFEDETLFMLRGYQYYWSEEKFWQIRKMLNDVLEEKYVDSYRQNAEKSPICLALKKVWQTKNLQPLYPFCKKLDLLDFLEKYLTDINNDIVEIRYRYDRIELLCACVEKDKEYANIVKFSLEESQILHIEISTPQLDFCTGEKCWNLKNKLNDVFKNRMEKMIPCGLNRLQQAAAGIDFFQKIPDQTPEGMDYKWYWDNFGHIINSDCAKMAFIRQGYRPEDPASVSEFHQKASAWMHCLINEILYDKREVYPGKTVIFMAGGNGSGKSTFCDGIKAHLGSNWVIDATLASLEAARCTMESVFALGGNAVIIHIIREPEEAWQNGVLKRAANGSHCTPRSVFEFSHRVVAENVATLEKEFARKGLLVYRVENK